MKQLVFKLKNYIRERWILIRASAVNTFQIDTAFPLNNWGNIISSGAYAITTILFINILYSNVKTIAGYSRDEMLFFTFLSQIVFISTWMFSARNVLYITEAVNSGELDLVLTKPIPALFYMSSKTIDIYSVTRDYFIGGLALVITINWGNLHIDQSNLVIGILIVILGFIISHCIHFISALPVFWLGENSAFVDLFYFFDYEFFQGLPFEGFSVIKGIQVIFTFIIPMLISSGLSSAVILNKIDAAPALLLSAILCIIFLILLNKLWKLALKNYTSASS